MFSSPKSVFVYEWYKLQSRVVKVKLRTIFWCLFMICSRKRCFYNYHYFRCSIYLQDLKVFDQRKGHICYYFRIAEFISRM